MKKNHSFLETYSFTLGSEREAKAWAEYVKSRVEVLDKWHDSPYSTQVTEEIKNRKVIIKIDSPFYPAGYVMSMIYPVMETLLNPKVLFYSLDEIRLCGRAKQAFQKLGCKNLGDTLCISAEKFLSLPKVGKSSWRRYTDILGQYGLKEECSVKNWSFGNQKVNAELFGINGVEI